MDFAKTVLDSVVPVAADAPIEYYECGNKTRTGEDGISKVTECFVCMCGYGYTAIMFYIELGLFALMIIVLLLRIRFMPDRKELIRRSIE